MTIRNINSLLECVKVFLHVKTQVDWVQIRTTNEQRQCEQVMLSTIRILWQNGLLTCSERRDKSRPEYIISQNNRNGRFRRIDLIMRGTVERFLFAICIILALLVFLSYTDSYKSFHPRLRFGESRTGNGGGYNLLGKNESLGGAPHSNGLTKVVPNITHRWLLPRVPRRGFERRDPGSQALRAGEVSQGQRACGFRPILWQEPRPQDGLCGRFRAKSEPLQEVER